MEDHGKWTSVYEGHKFEALKLRYEDQVQLLRTMTDIDLRVFSGYIAIQTALGGWLTQSTVDGFLMKIGLLILNFTLSSIAGWLLYNNYRRRIEVVKTVKNLNEAFGFTQKGIYLQDSPINATTEFRPWVYGYMLGIATGALAISILIFASPV